MKVFIALCGTLIITSGFIEVSIINIGIKSLSEIYEASNFVNNINQILEIALNNDNNLQKYCASKISSDVVRCNYMNSTQIFLNRQLYLMMLNSFTNFLTKQTDMFGVAYYESLNQNAAVYLQDSLIDIPVHEFIKIYYYSLQKVQVASPESAESQNNLKFLNDNWRLLKDINDKSIDFY
jgi:hypothetical protein